ncbi:MAG: hypothetical protein AMS24_03230 [Chlamydiae bacterium SM23_39]|nr:MAG: hypothetical protein AMS24_03230 [Chlamydiae bacterium SM23_39]
MDKGIYFSEEDLVNLLSSKNKIFFQKTLALTKRFFLKKVFLRGLIEFSNICEKNCYYCGLRKENKKTRYCMTEREIINTALWAYNNRYGSIMLQSGEVNSSSRIAFIIKIIKKIKKQTKNKLGIALCLGELRKETYLDFFKAGAHRYLLRIETSNPQLYQKLHPANHSYENRIKCLEILKSTGYQTGTGIIIGIHGQTITDLAKDLLFFKKIDIDMIGMGPYIPHPETPLFKKTVSLNGFSLCLKMIVLIRLMMPDINIAATTAMQASHPKGIELAIQAGANVIMPIVTPLKYCKDYSLYLDKPCIDETSSTFLNYLTKRMQVIGRELAFDQWGDPLHYYKRQKIC